MRRSEGGGTHARVLLLEAGASEQCAALIRDARLYVLEVRSFAHLSAMLPRFRPNVLVIAFDTPSAEDVDEVRRLHSATPKPILIISKPVEDRCVTDLIKAGAAGYLLAEEAGNAHQAIAELLRGGVPLSPAISRLVLGRARRSSAKMAAVVPPTGAPQLTSRQLETLRLLAEGHSYDAIARALGITVNTVRTHIRVIYDRIGASTRIEAVVAALALGLIDRPR